MAEDLQVPDDFFSIGEAMEDALDGDRIVVQPGTYKERIIIKAGVSLVSYDGDDGNDLVDGPGTKKVLRRTLRTIIDGSEITKPGYLISFAQETTAPMKLDGFTITNMPQYREINIFMMEIRACSPEVTNNILSKNRSWGGILSTGLGQGMGPALETGASPRIHNNVIYGHYGPGIASGGNSETIIEDNELFENQFPDAVNTKLNAPAIGMRETARPIIRNNLCYRNGSGISGIFLDSHENPIIVENNVSINNVKAGISFISLGGEKTNIKVIIKGNTIYGNRETGMRLSRIDEAHIIDNEFFANRKSGATLYHVDKAHFLRNNIYGNLKTGIRLLDVKTAVIRHNRIYQNIAEAIDLIAWDN